MKRLYPVFILILFLSLAAVSASDLNVTEDAPLSEDLSDDVISVSEVGDDLNEISEVELDSADDIITANSSSDDSSKFLDYDYYRLLVDYYRDNRFGDLEWANPANYPVQGPEEVYTWLTNNLDSANIDYSKLVQYLNERIPNATVYFADDFKELNDQVQDFYKNNYSQYETLLRSIMDNIAKGASDYQNYYDLFGDIFNSIANVASGNATIDSLNWTQINDLAKELYEYILSLYPRNLSADDLVKYYGDSKRFEARALANGTVVFTINGVEYTKPIVNNTASMAINLNPGVYGVTTYCPQLNDSISNTITVLSTIESKDLVKYYKDASRFEVSLLDGSGNYINASANVTFNINGVLYTRQYANGTAGLNINLDPGSYIITTTNPFNGEEKSNNITVFSYIESYDLVKYYKNESQFVVKVLNKTSGSVTFNINGVFYTRQINQTGHAKLNINLAPGEYIITSICGDYVNSNKITVLSILEAQDLEMYVWDGSKFLVKALDGKGNRLGGVNITFNINGVFYNRTTDVNGIARLNINLSPGDYIITSMYNGLAISNNIHIKQLRISEYETILNAVARNAIYDVIDDIGINILSFDKDSTGEYLVRLGDLMGNVIGSLRVTDDGIVIK